MPDQKPTSKYLKSGRISLAVSTDNGSRVSFEERVITDVIMCQVGEAKGHGVHLEQSFIEDGIAYANKYHSKIGLKCRFGHPAMSNDALGTEVGRFKNFRVVDDKMVADLHIFKSANLSPTHPGAGDWILSMADEDPNAIMCSIIFKPGKKYQYDDEGNKYYLKIIYDKYGVSYGTENPDQKYDSNKPVFVELKELFATDLVDEGAATDKLFSAIANPDKFAVIATQFLDENPRIAEFLQHNPEKLEDFLQTYKGLKNQIETNKSKQMKIKFQTAWAFALAFFGLADKKEEELPEVTAEHFGKLSDECTRLSGELAQAAKDKEALQAQVDQLGKDNSSLTEQVSGLETTLAQEQKDKAAYCALAEKYRAAAGEAFIDTKPEQAEEIQADNGGEKKKEFADYSVNKRAIAEISNI
jgi:hypothetical protein